MVCLFDRIQESAVIRETGLLETAFARRGAQRPGQLERRHDRRRKADYARGNKQIKKKEKTDIAGPVFGGGREGNLSVPCYPFSGNFSSSMRGVNLY